jgi:phosphocarrier protein HPr
MVTCTVTVRNTLGMHARAAAKFVHAASAFAARVTVARGERVVDGKSILGVLLLAAARGTDIVITADGADERDVLEALSALVESGFGEGPCTA